MKITTQFNALFKIQPVILRLFFKYSLATINSQLIPIKKPYTAYSVGNLCINLINIPR